MTQQMVRVYHPTLNAFEDVPGGDRKAWEKSGWLASKPEHVDDSQAVEIGTAAPVDIVAE